MNLAEAAGAVVRPGHFAPSRRAIHVRRSRLMQAQHGRYQAAVRLTGTYGTGIQRRGLRNLTTLGAGRGWSARMRVREVLAGVDDSIAGRNAVDWAAQRASERALRLNLVRVVPGPWVYQRASQYRQAMAQARELLEAESSRLSALMPELEVVTTRRTGETAVVLRQLSDASETVVVGSDRAPDSHGEGSGAVSFQVAVVSRSPVAVIPAFISTDSSGVLVGVDGSADSAVAVDFACREALRLGEDLTVVHVEPTAGVSAATVKIQPGGHETEPKSRRLLSAASLTARDLYPGLDIHEALETDDSPAFALIHAARHARLLVIGCRGRGGIRKPVGTVAEKILQHLPCPTIVTRPANGHE
ncbi:Universal stress protein MSMEG_3950/MSMEI_3859 [Arthrobacter sp. Bi83]|uniref:universal stress protein n=1 Tax=Arthrobacter sp. Bi83 TaxID=2822353 RepID=UPI001D4FDC78|nr:Universal stress protein MSMEG_3950/MSMEI_3859 [Arthrobacter sp. Bi83]